MDQYQIFRRSQCRNFEGLWIKVYGGGYQDFPSNSFSLTVPKNFVGPPCCAVFQKLSGSEKVYG